MEPCFNPALESQVIGSVYRLGQKRPVVITRLIHEDSIESRLVKYREKKFGGHPSPPLFELDVNSSKSNLSWGDFAFFFGIDGANLDDAMDVDNDDSSVHTAPAAQAVEMMIPPPSPIVLSRLLRSFQQDCLVVE